MALLPWLPSGVLSPLNSSQSPSQGLSFALLAPCIMSTKPSASPPDQQPHSMLLIQGKVEKPKEEIKGIVLGRANTKAPKEQEEPTFT